MKNSKYLKTPLKQIFDIKSYKKEIITIAIINKQSSNNIVINQNIILESDLDYHY